MISFGESTRILFLPSVKTLNKCKAEKDTLYALKLLHYMHRTGVDVHKVLGNYLVPLLVDVGRVENAQHIFHSLWVRNEYSYHCLIMGYSKCGNAEQVLAVYQSDDYVCNDGHAFVALLKACIKLKNLDVGQKIHGDAIRLGLIESDSFVGNTLLDMYVKCGSIQNAKHVFDNLLVRDVVSWTTLMVGYVELGDAIAALEFYECMHFEGIHPDTVTFACVLNACSDIGDVDTSQQMHTEIEKKGLIEEKLLLGNTLMKMYVRCGSLGTAHHIFDKLPLHDLVSWTTLILGYAEHGYDEEALKYFKKMQDEGFSPDAVTYVCILNSCGNTRAVDKGFEIHSQIDEKGLFNKYRVIGNALVDMYGKFGMLMKAQEVFNDLIIRDVVSWTSLIASYAEYGYSEEALKCFHQMQVDGVEPNVLTYASVLTACCTVGVIDIAQEIHSDLERRGLLEIDFVVGVLLIGFYAKLGLLIRARQVFDKLLYRTVVSWTALVAGYAEFGASEEALKCFEQMHQESILPNAVTIVYLLNVCGKIQNVSKIQELHLIVVLNGWFGADLIVSNCLIENYAICGMLTKAQQTFNQLPFRDTVSWNSIITAFHENRHHGKALECFLNMQTEGMVPSDSTFTRILKTCGSVASGNNVHGIIHDIEMNGLVKSDLYIGNTLIDFYAKCSLIWKAQDVFNTLPVRDVISWNALISGYVDIEHNNEALWWFDKMQAEGFSPDAVTYISILKACATVGATEKGQEIHMQVEKKGIHQGNIVLGNMLVNMYAKCNLLSIAQQVFSRLGTRDVTSWSTLIAGFAKLGKPADVFCIFEKMLAEGINPDPVTFLIILNACSRTGLRDTSNIYFQAMSKDYGIEPTLEHHTGMVDLLCRSGDIDNAIQIIKKMPFCPNLIIWLSVLSACKTSGNIDVGRVVFHNVVQLIELKCDDKAVLL